MVVGVDEIGYTYLMNGVVAPGSLRALSSCFRRLGMAESYEDTKSKLKSNYILQICLATDLPTPENPEVQLRWIGCLRQ
jgi:hypothetical protein